MTDASADFAVRRQDSRSLRARERREFLWTNSALNSVESPRAYHASDDWQNSGGNRTWLAPEVDFFFPKFPNIDIAGYWQPRSLDPGSNELTKTVDGVELANRHSRATVLRKNGTPEDLQKQWIGHSSLRTTDRYSHTDQELEYRPLAASKAGLNFVVGPNGPKMGECLVQ